MINATIRYERLVHVDPGNSTTQKNDDRIRIVQRCC